jgi:hypothetical protein
MEEKARRTCPNCGSEHIEEGISIGQSAEVGNIGPQYKSNFIMTGVSQLYCDLCLDCGEAVRFFIKDKTDRNWIKKPGNLGSK